MSTKRLVTLASTGKPTPPPGEQESLDALSRAREHVAVLSVLIDRMNDALQRAELDNDSESELGALVAPTAVRLAGELRNDVWTIESIGGAK